MSCRTEIIARVLGMSLLTAGLCGAAQVKIGERTFTLPDGFTIEQIAGPGVVDRPIVGDFDEQGRLYVADSSGTGDRAQKQLADKPHRILRLEASDDGVRFDRSSVFAAHMMFPEGVMWYAGSVYVGAPPSIWKLTAVDGTGEAKQQFEWLTAKTLTNCANDIHGPYMGPDGWIYWCKGAFAEQTYARPGKRPMVSRAAHIFRARPDGAGLEPVMTGGMDNPVHVVFTPGGERIFTTTFLQHPENGKRDGIIHAVYGGLYGKVNDVTDNHPHTSPDLMPVLVHLGPAAASGLCRYESDAFGPPYRDNLFATSFNLHKVTRHALTEDGATFSATSEDFVVCDCVDFHPTDVIEDADGSLLVIDTGGWYKLCCPTSQFAKPDVLGAIYRVRRIGAAKMVDPRGLKLDWAGMDGHALVELLDDGRPFIRKRAVQTLANRGVVDAVAVAVKSGASARARVNALWAVTRIEGPAARAAARAGLNDADETVRQVAAHSASVWRDRGAVDGLIKLLDSPWAHNRRVAAEALGRIGDRRAVPRILAELGKSNDRVLDHSLTYALIDIGDARGTSAGLASQSAAVRRAAMIALDQMENGDVPAEIVAANLSAADPALRQTATWIAGRHAEWGAALAGALSERIGSAQDDAQFVAQLGKLTHSAAISEMFVSLLGDPKTPVSARRVILGAMAESGLSPVPKNWLDALRRLLEAGDPATVADATGTISKLPLKMGADGGIGRALLGVAGNESLPAEVRLEALAAVPGRLTEINGKHFDFLVSQLANDRSANGRMLAAQAIGRSKVNSQQLMELTHVIAKAGPLEIDPLLAAYQQSSNPGVGEQLAAALEAAPAVGALRADAVEKAVAKFGPRVKTRAQRIVAKLNPDAAAQQARLDQLLASLPAGDVRRGQGLFNSAKAACYSCHQIGYVGGRVGPDLTRVGAIRTRRDLIESVVFPSASFVQSFEPTMVVMTNGDRQYGIVHRNDASEVIIVTGPNQEVHIARKDVAQMLPGTVSVMPAGFADQLSQQELGDLVAFLGACR
jgi:putative membrane-bound dehydrogenase-like protein